MPVHDVETSGNHSKATVVCVPERVRLDYVSFWLNLAPNKGNLLPRPSASTSTTVNVPKPQRLITWYLGSL